MTTQIFVLALVGMLCVLVYNLARMALNKQDSKYNREETELMQELYHGLTQMEKRVETLETLLLDRPDRDSKRKEFDR